MWKAVGAIGAIGGPLLGGLLGKSSAKAQNRAASEEAEISREFTKEQMQNRHQWEVDDLKKAGLNPVLSANSGAAVGGSAQAPVVGTMDQMSKGVESAVSALTLRRMESEIKNINQDTQKKRAEESVAKSTERLQSSQLPGTSAQSRLIEDLSRLKEAIVQPLANSANSISRNAEKFWDWYTKPFKK